MPDPHATPDRAANANRILDHAAVAYLPTHVFALFSGGHDSLCSTHIAAQHPSFTAAVHVNTGIGIEETREFVRDTCWLNGWPLLEYHPPKTYVHLVGKFGFPGPAQHSLMYRSLKERCIRRLISDHKSGIHDRIGLVTGVRSTESTRRMGNVEPVKRQGAALWIAPIHDWTKPDCNAYIERHGLQRNTVVDTLHMSGECLCGAFAAPGEIHELERWYPEVAKQIHAIEDAVREDGRKACVWGQRPPRVSDDQLELDMPLCRSCEARFAV